MDFSPAIITAIAAGLTGIIAGYGAYRSQSRQLKTDWEKAQAEFKTAGTTEFEAINAGNKSLREALMEQLKNAYADLDRIREEHDHCTEKLRAEQQEHEKRLAAQARRIRYLEKVLNDSGIRIVVDNGEDS